MKRRTVLLTAIALVVTLLIVWFLRDQTRHTTTKTPPQDAAQTPPASGTLVHVRVVGLDQKPLAGMLPIATEKPNAFDEPLARGKPTDAQGKSSIILDPNRWLCVRAWDPQLRFFANNYYDVPAGKADVSEELLIVMVEGARLKARLFAPDGAPAQNENVGLMMFHPEKGPWWPAEADTDADGNVVFDRVPAGQFLLTLKTQKSGKIDLPAVFLPPAGETDVGKVQLLPE